MVSIAKIGAVLTLDSTQFEGASRTAEATTRRFGGSLDSIVGKLEAQRASMQENATVAAIYAAAEKGANAASVQYALSLERRIQQEKKLREARELEVAAENRRKSAIMQTIQMMEQQVRTYGMTSTQLAIYRLNEMGATADELKHALALHQKIQALESSGTAYQQATVAAMQNMAATTRGMMIAQQLSFAIEDAATQYGDQGLAGAIRASANNLVMVGMLMGGQTGIYVALASAALQLGMALTKAGKNAKDAGSDFADFEKHLERVKKSIESAHDIHDKLAGITDMASGAKAMQDVERQIGEQKKIIEVARRNMDEAENKWAFSGTLLERFFGTDPKAIEKHREEMNKFASAIIEAQQKLAGLEGLQKEIGGRQKDMSQRESVMAQNALKYAVDGLSDAIGKQNEKMSESANKWREFVNGPMGEYQDKLNELEKLNKAGMLKPGVFEKAKTMLTDEFYKPSSATQSLLDKQLSKQEKFAKGLEGIQKDLALGKITEAQYDVASKQLMSDVLIGSKGKSAVASGAAGSTDAYQTIAGAIMSYQSSKTNDPTKIAMQQLAEQKKVPQLLQQIKDKFEPVMKGALD